MEKRRDVSHPGGVRKRQSSRLATVAKTCFSTPSKVTEFADDVAEPLDQFDFDAAAGVPKARIQELAGLAFIERRENVIFLGPSGTGKSHLATALGIRAAERRYKFRFITAADLVLQLEKARREHRFDQYLKRAILGPSLLILDEIGYLPLKKDQSDLFFQVVAKRYEQGSVILAS